MNPARSWLRFVGPLLLGAAPAALNAQAAAPPRWTPNAPDNAQLLANFSYASVEPVLTAIGARFQRSGQAPRPALLVTFPNNRRASLIFSSCDPAGACKALSIQSFWTRIANSPPETTAQAIALFNQRYSFGKAFIAADGRPALQRYLTADYGFIRGNLAVNLLVFANQAEQFATQVLRPLEGSPK
jgi:hypothetical protein